ncbi:MAG: hypothetical protein WDN28_23970 [Chthoniobacter sp.]
MESLDGKEKLPEFVAAYHKLLERFSAAGKRRILVVGPTGFSSVPDQAISPLEMQIPIAQAANQLPDIYRLPGMNGSTVDQRDGIHFTAAGQARFAKAVVFALLVVQRSPRN